MIHEISSEASQAPIRVVQYGLGPIGLQAAETILTKEETGKVKLVGAVDIDPEKAGQDLGTILNKPVPLGIPVLSDIEALLQAEKPDVVLHATSSYLDRMSDQVMTCLRGGANVISSSEELFFPYGLHPTIASELDAVAREHGVVVMGTGVNPGFAMDTLALTATAVCTEVSAIRVTRVVDAGKRRLPLQRKVGAGLSIEQFRDKRQKGSFGHVGLQESILYLVDGLGWRINHLEEMLYPVIAERDVSSPYFKIGAGMVSGLHHKVDAYSDEERVLTLDLKMYVGAEDPYDAVTVLGNPPVDLVIKGGIFGDTATVAMMVNAIPLILNAEPGLRTAKDLPMPRAWASSPHLHAIRVA